MTTVKNVLRKKRDGEELQEDEVKQFISALVSGNVNDAQLGAMMMATYLNGLTGKETAWLTKYMTSSGETLSWPDEWAGRVVDKHSTGGIGDKISLPLVAVLTACSSAKVPMISGRGLGITGGTLDKLESIKGFRVALSPEEIKEGLERHGAVICGQTGDIVPADRLMYACRDETETVCCRGLINASIISKKAAEGLDALVLDVKYGVGSTSKSVGQAEQLAQEMVFSAESMGIKCRALISEMDNPIGRKIGNSLEIQETVEFLLYEDEGEKTKDLKELVFTLGSHMLEMTGQVSTLSEGLDAIETCLIEGKALKAFREIIIFQGVPLEVADKLCCGRFSESLPQADTMVVKYKGREGFVAGINAAIVGQLVVELGGGRLQKTDTIDHAVGLEFLKVIGDPISSGDHWVKIHHNSALSPDFLSRLEPALQTSDSHCGERRRVLKVIGRTPIFGNIENGEIDDHLG